MISSDIKNISLAEQGRSKIENASKNMPVVEKIKEEFASEKALEGYRIGACLHVTVQTAVLMIALKKGGADVALCASNPLSTQDDIAASLVKHYDIPVFAVKGENKETYYRHLDSVLDRRPQITMDDGADLVSKLHSERSELAKDVLGSTEETTTGVIRIKSLEKNGLLDFPVIAVNDAQTKYLFDNRYGTGQSTIDGILRATNHLLAGSTFVVAGYGWCGRGLAMRARGMGAHVIVTEIDPIKSIEAIMDGFRVMPMEKAAKIGEIFVTLTGNKSVINLDHFKLMPEGAIVANSGHFNVEIQVNELKEYATKSKNINDSAIQYTLPGEKNVILLSEGRLVNLSAAEGHPSQVMDMSFANQALSARYIAENSKSLKNKVYKVPLELDRRIAFLKLESMDVSIDELTEEQVEYLDSWQAGTE